MDPDSYTFHGMSLTNISGGRRLGKKYDKKYGSERLLETCYNSQLSKHRAATTLFVTAEYQHISNPGYSKGRGPAGVVSTRFPLEL